MMLYCRHVFKLALSRGRKAQLTTQRNNTRVHLHIEIGSAGLYLLEVPGSINILVHLLQRDWKRVNKESKKKKDK